MLFSKERILAHSFLIPGFFLLCFGWNPPTGHTGAPGEATCSACHASNVANDGVGSIALSSSGFETYQSGAEFSMTLKMKRPGAEIFGFSVTALNENGDTGGDLLVQDSIKTFREEFSKVYISHNHAPSPESLDQDSTERTFTWVAPDTSEGPITFYFVGHLVDTNIEGTIDGWVYNDSLTIYPGPPAPLGGTNELTDRAIKAFPNPVRENEPIQFNHPKGMKYLKVYDGLGREMQTVDVATSAGQTELHLDQPGIHHCILEPINGNAQVVKILVRN